MRADEIAKAADAASTENRTWAALLRRAVIDSGARRALPLRDGRSAPPPGSGGGDPLAQLARLIEQDETFGAIVRNSRSEQRAELSGRREPPSFQLAREDNPFAPARRGDAVAPLVPSFLCDGPTGEPHDPHEPDEHDGPDYSNGLPRQRSGLGVFVALGLALVGSASAMAYWAWTDGRARSDEARVIGASIAPDKTVPSPQGQDSRSDERPGGQSGEQSVNGGVMTGAERPADAQPAAVVQPVPPTGLLYGPAPAKVAELTPAPAPPGSPAGPALNPPADVKEAPPSETAPSAAAPGATAPGGADGPHYVVQLSSQRSEAAAQATSRTLQTKHAAVFAGREPFIRRSDLGDRGVYYRVLTGPFPVGEAKELCGNLKKSGGDCVVQKD